MQHVVLSVADWVYLAFIIITFACLATRRDALLPTLVGLLLTGIALKGNLLGGVLVVYKAILAAGIDLLNIIVIVASITALTKTMADMGTDRIIVAPARRFLRNPTMAFWTLAVVTLLLSWVIRATPTAALLGALLVPAAVVAGMSPMVAAMILSIVGKGMGLSSDYLSQGTVSFTAKVTKIPAAELFAASLPIWLTVSGVTMLCVFFMTRKMQKVELEKRQSGNDGHVQAYREAVATYSVEASPFAKAMAVMIPLTFIVDVYAMITWKLSGNDAMALMGGTFYVLALICSLGHYREKAFDKLLDNVRTGWIFAVKVFGPVVVIGGFFWLGGDSLKEILGDHKTQGLAYDWGYFIAEHMPINKFTVALLATLGSAFAAFDGAGFAAIPLGASIAMALGKPIGANVAYLASMAQMSAIWVGATLVPWGFLAVTASVCNVDPQDLSRKNFLPVILGLFAGVIVTALLA
ncbi:hypothetical protein [Anaerospora sp.]|uniref:hypothetical protein n=1 Tax=Anaerospora sp. TaxID=1960278 RepID=UPI00289F7B2D|nr:hypothetical protein [Anaerospora sp.]